MNMDEMQKQNYDFDNDGGRLPTPPTLVEAESVVSFRQPQLPFHNSTTLEDNNNPAIDNPPEMKGSSSGQWEVEDNVNPAPAIGYPSQYKGSSFSGQSEVEEKDKTSCWRSKRLLLDLKELWQDAPRGIHASPSEENIYIWNILFPAPNQKKVEATLHFEPNYPFVPPAIIIKKRLFHPNITPEGKVCLQDLQKLWTPAYSIWSLILTVQLLLDDPNPNDAVNTVAGKMLLKYPQAYYNRAWQCFDMLDSCENFNLEDIKEDELKFLFEA